MEQRNFRQIITDADKKAVIDSLDHECVKVCMQPPVGLLLLEAACTTATALAFSLHSLR